MNRKLGTNFITDLGTTWSGYDGDEIYGDFTVATSSPWTVTNTNSYEPGMWRKIGTTGSYVHGDHLGTLRRLTNSGGGLVAGSSRAYTAFGEQVGGMTDRFGYVGASGYQSTLSASGAELFPYLHVGARYYDPSSGSFLQRDPIGILGSLNVYSYADSSPLGSIDPTGLFSWIDWGLRQGKRVADKIVQIVTGHKPPPISAPLMTSVSVLPCVPDLARIKIAVDHRRTTLLEDNGDNINDAMDKYEQKHDQRVKPRSGPAG